MKTKNPLRIVDPAVVALVVVGVVSLGLLAYNHSDWQMDVRRYVPLLDNVKEARVSLAIGHLWLEEMVTGDETIRPEAIWALLDHVVQLFENCQNGTSSVANLQGVSITDRELLDQLEHLKVSTKQLGAIAKERWDGRETSGVGSAIDQRFDAAFNEMDHHAAEIDQLVHRNISTMMAHHRNVYFATLGLWAALLCVACGGLFVVGTKRKRVQARIERLNRLKGNLLSPGGLDEKTKCITDNMVEIFDADFARIWLIKPGDLCESGCLHAGRTEGPHVCRDRDRCLHLVASSGRYTHIDGKVHSRVPFGCYKIGRVAAAEEQGFLTNNVAHDPRVHDRQWARQLGLVSFAGYRLVSPDGTPRGVLALFGKRAMSPDDARLVETIAGTTSQVVQMAAAEEGTRVAHEQLLEQQRSEMDRAEMELDKVREQLVARTRLAAIGQVAGSIAHELRNPLGAARNAAFYIKRYVSRPEPDLIEHLNIIDEEINAADGIITDLMNMVRAAPPSKQEVDVGQILREVLERVGLADGIQYRMTLDPDPLTVSADPGQLRQVLANLLTNAADATKGNGQITVEAVRKKDCSEITVRDNGVGVAAEDRDRLFEPLFTTKAKGTGLGLTICREIVERHGGSIELVDCEQPGTSFRIRLPRQMAGNTPHLRGE